MNNYSFSIEIQAGSDTFAQPDVSNLPFSYEIDGDSIQIVGPPVSNEPIGITGDLPTSPPSSPVISLIRSNATFSGDDYTSFMKTFKIVWEFVETAAYYQVFMVEDSSNSVLKDTEQDPLNVYTNNPFFTRQSGPIKGNQNTFEFEYDDIEKIQKLNLFVFAYNSAGRSAFPNYMVSIITTQSSSGFSVNSMFLEYTSFREDDKPISLNFIDGSNNFGGQSQNVESIPMTKYVPPVPSEENYD